jgi:putative DNA primase/helicase
MKNAINPVLRPEDIARGKWLSILPQLGVDPKFLVNRHGACPICGGKDRFRWDDKEGRGTFICNSCGAGDGFRLAQLVTGKSFRTICETITSITGMHPTSSADHANRVRQKQVVKAIWDAAEAVSSDGPVATYLNNRLGLQWRSKSIREYRGSNLIWHPDAKKSFPAMVAQVVGSDNFGHNVHITYLTEDGQKANVKPAKRVGAGQIPDGCAIRLAPSDVHMGIAEGIETAIAASVLHSIPVWSAINAHNLAKWKPPAVVRKVTIFGDNDESYTGHKAAYTLASRLIVQEKLEVEVKIPDRVGDDWADVLARASKGRDLP